jgi:hypothetical protein
MNWTWQGKVTSAFLSIFLFLFTWKKINRKKAQTNKIERDL